MPGSPAAVAAAVAEARRRYDAALAAEADEAAEEARVMRLARADPVYRTRPIVVALCAAAFLAYLATVMSPFYVEMSGRNLDGFSMSVKSFPSRPAAGLIGGAAAACFAVCLLTCSGSREGSRRRALGAAIISLVLGAAGFGAASTDAVAARAAREASESRAASGQDQGGGGEPSNDGMIAAAFALAATAASFALLVRLTLLDKLADAAETKAAAAAEAVAASTAGSVAGSVAGVVAVPSVTRIAVTARGVTLVTLAAEAQDPLPLEQGGSVTTNPLHGGGKSSGSTHPFFL